MLLLFLKCNDSGVSIHRGNRVVLIALIHWYLRGNSFQSEGSKSALGEKSIAAVVDTTAQFLEAMSKQNLDALNFAEKAGNAALSYVDTSTNQEANAEKMTNKTLWVAGAVVALWLFMKYRKGA